MRWEYRKTTWYFDRCPVCDFPLKESRCPRCEERLRETIAGAKAEAARAKAALSQRERDIADRLLRQAFEE